MIYFRFYSDSLKFIGNVFEWFSSPCFKLMARISRNVWSAGEEVIVEIRKEDLYDLNTLYLSLLMTTPVRWPQLDGSMRFYCHPFDITPRTNGFRVQIHFSYILTSSYFLKTETGKFNRTKSRDKHKTTHLYTEHRTFKRLIIRTSHVDMLEGREPI